MFISMVQFPAIKEGQDEAFKDWFKWSNSEFRKLSGFIRRSLLEPENGGTYVAIVEMHFWPCIPVQYMRKLEKKWLHYSKEIRSPLFTKS